MQPITQFYLLYLNNLVHIELECYNFVIKSRGNSDSVIFFASLSRSQKTDFVESFIYVSPSIQHAEQAEHFIEACVVIYGTGFGGSIDRMCI